MTRRKRPFDESRAFEIPKGIYVNKETGKEIYIDGGWYFSNDTDYARGEPALVDPVFHFKCLRNHYLMPRQRRNQEPSKNS